MYGMCRALMCVVKISGGVQKGVSGFQVCSGVYCDDCISLCSDIVFMVFFFSLVCL